MHTMIGHVEVATVVRGLLLLIGLGALWTVRMVRPDWQMQAGVLVAGCIFATTLLPNSAFDVCTTKPRPAVVPGWPSPKR
jgi:hypothetical protein